MQSIRNVQPPVAKPQRSVAAAALPSRAELTKKASTLIGGLALSVTLLNGAVIGPANASPFMEKFSQQEEQVKAQKAKLQALLDRQTKAASKAVVRTERTTGTGRALRIVCD